MHFCNNCNNMFYISINEDDSNQLEYYCRHCGNKESTFNSTTNFNNICILNTEFQKNNISFERIINKYTKLDPTLPRTTTILCPNEECVTNNSSNSNNVNNEVIFIRYNNSDMKYVYLCCHCDKVWTNNNNNNNIN